MSDATPTPVSEEVSQAATRAIERIARRDNTVAPDVDAGEPEIDGVVFVKNGWVRVVSNGTTWRLRRPFLGELRTLDTAREAINDELQDASDDVVAESDKLQTQADKHNASTTLSDSERRKKIRGLRRKDRELSNRLNALTEERMLDWWGQVFSTLGVDGALPDGEQPAFLVDPSLPAKIVKHWRTNP